MRKNGLIFVFVKICGRCFLIHFIKWGGVIFFGKISHTAKFSCCFFQKTSGFDKSNFYSVIYTALLTAI